MLETIVFPETEADELLEKILKFKLEKNISDMIMLDLIFEYANATGESYIEIGETLSESEEFKSFMEKELIESKYIKIKNRRQKKDKDVNDSEW
jgi:hypothetical protein